MSTKTFLEDMHDKFMVNPITTDEFVMFRYVFVSIEEISIDGIMELISIRSVRQGHGIASKALDELLRMADKHGVEIIGFVSPMPHWAHDKNAVMSQDDLREWYQRHGFVLDKNGYVNYYPRKHKHENSACVNIYP